MGRLSMGRKTETETSGQRLLRECTERYEFSPAEAAILEQAATLADLAERLAAEIADQPLTGVGAAGQLVANPLHADLQRTAAKFVGLVDSLRFPDRPSSKMTTSERASHAARARWAGRSA